jgi:aspartate dehydrogenase
MGTQLPMAVGVIGGGAIAHALLRCLGENDARGSIEIVAMLDRSAEKLAAFAPLAPRADLTTEPEVFWSRSPSLVVECAGHQAVRELGPEVLARGRNLLLVSIGALADPETEQRLRAAASNSGGRLFLPSGAVGGLDLLASARLAGLSRVVYRARKPPLAWRGTAAEQLVELDTLKKPVEFFNGNARMAAQKFPQNANVAAAIALAGLGFEATEVILTVDPEAKGNEHSFRAEGAFGHAEIKIVGNPLPDNPKTSWLAALSVARAVLNANSRVVI